MKESVLEYVRYRLSRATETLGAAKLMLASGYLSDAINRLYYSCFYAVSALLLAEGFSSARHSGIRSLFLQHWIHQKRLPEELGRFYLRLFEHRQRADYRDLEAFERKDVERWIEEAAAFVSQVSAQTERILASRPGKEDRDLE